MCIEQIESVSVYLALEEFNLKWRQAEAVLISLLQKQAVSPEELQKCSENIRDCSIVSVSDVYEKVKQLLDGFTATLGQKIQANRNCTISQYAEEYQQFSDNLSQLSDLCSQVNEYIETKNTLGNGEEHLMKIGHLGGHLWKDNILKPNVYFILRLLFEKINKYRILRPLDYTTSKLVIMSFMAQEKEEEEEEDSMEGKDTFYFSHFEKYFLQMTSTFYKTKSEFLQNRNNCSVYMTKVFKMLEQEQEILGEILPLKKSEKMVMKAVEKALITDHFSYFESECKQMVVNDKREDLTNLYLLLKLGDLGIDTLVMQVTEHFKFQGIREVVTLDPDDVDYIENYIDCIIQLHEQHQKYVATVFDGDDRLVAALNEALTAVVGFEGQPSCHLPSSHIVPIYMHNFLMPYILGGEDYLLGTRDIVNRTKKVRLVYTYMKNKESFFKRNSKKLTKRLIYYDNALPEVEMYIIEKLGEVTETRDKDEITKNLLMINELMSSSKLTCAFNTSRQSNLNFSIKIFKENSTPLRVGMLHQLNIPPPLAEIYVAFNRFYHADPACQHRKINWQFHLSEVLVTFNYTSRRYKVIMSTYHFAILQLFENVDKLKYWEIKELTGIDNEQLLKRYLNSFVDANILLRNNDDVPTLKPIVIKATKRDHVIVIKWNRVTMIQAPQEDEEEQNRAFHKQTNLLLNKEFSNRWKHFKVVLEYVEQPNLPHAQHPAAVEARQKQTLQAAILRVMKAHKTLNKQKLMEAVLYEVRNRFIPTAQYVQQQIETLIDIEYLKCGTNPDEYEMFD